MVKIRNSKSKQEREVSEKEWETIQKNDLINNWSIVEVAKKPKELAEFEAKKETAKVETPKNTTNNGKDK